MRNNQEFSTLIIDCLQSKSGGYTKKDFFRDSFYHYFNTGEYSDNQISRMVSELQNPSGNIPDNFIVFYNKNRDYLYEDIEKHLITNMYLVDTNFIEKYNLDENDLARSIYLIICKHLRIPA